MHEILKPSLYPHGNRYFKRSAAWGPFQICRPYLGYPHRQGYAAPPGREMQAPVLKPSLLAPLSTVLQLTTALAIHCCLLMQPISTSATWVLRRSLEPSSLGVVLAAGCAAAWRWDRKQPIYSTAATQRGCKCGDGQLQPHLGMFHIAKLSKIFLYRPWFSMLPLKTSASFSKVTGFANIHEYCSQAI